MKRRSRKNKFFLVLVVVGLCPLANAAPALSATVYYSGKRVTGKPAADHRPLAQSIHIGETEECSVKSVGSTALEVSERCKYLRGLYRYIYVPEGHTARHQILVGFSLMRSSAISHIVLAESPVEIEETQLTP